MDASNEDNDTKTHGAQGDMPRGQWFGYVFGKSGNDFSWLLAHELGHGVFTLKHLNDANYAGKSSLGSIRNLMDYTKSTALAAFQWNVMANPAPITGFDSDDASNVRLDKTPEQFKKICEKCLDKYLFIKHIVLKDDGVVSKYSIAYSKNKNNYTAKEYDTFANANHKSEFKNYIVIKNNNRELICKSTPELDKLYSSLSVNERYDPTSDSAIKYLTLLVNHINTYFCSCNGNGDEITIEGVGWRTQTPSECLATCKAIIHEYLKSDVDLIGGRGSSNNRVLYNRNSSEFAPNESIDDTPADINRVLERQNVNMNETLKELDQCLKEGRPVVVGVFRMKKTKENEEHIYGVPANTSPSATHHFVYIAGKHKDETGRIYYHFHEVGTSNPSNGKSDNNRLYLEAGIFRGKTEYSKNTAYIVTEIRLTQKPKQ